jgi:WD40 repeat protein
MLLALLTALLPPNVSHAQTSERCFPQTGYCISGRIRQFWEQNGGLAVFGFPVTEQRHELNRDNQSPYQTQWFERVRLELHPENQAPYDVLLGRLGSDRLRQDLRDWQQFPRSDPQAGCRYFGETQQNICGPILRAWRASGLEFDGRPGKSEAESLALFGLPISPVMSETVEGRTYQVQWYERARFELHPENAAPYDVLLGRLGAETRDVARASGAGMLAYLGNDRVCVISASGWGGPTCLLSGVDPSWSPDGRTLALVGPDGKLLLVDAASGRQLRVLDTSAANPSWSPDGRRIAFTAYTPAQPFRIGQIAVVNADGSGRTVLTSEGSSIAPMWSPDGAKIAFYTRRLPDAPYYPERKDHQLALINPDGSGFTALAEIGQASDATWHPSGRSLAFSSQVNGVSQIVALSIADRTYETLTSEPEGAMNPSWSPSGARLAYQSARPGPYNAPVIVSDANGQGRREVGFGVIGAPIRWSPDSTRVAFTTDVRVDRRVVVAAAEGTPTGDAIAVGSGGVWRP